MFKRILIANRGEIALRVLRACRELEIETVAVYSTADAESLPVQLATQAVCIGPAPAGESYLNQNALLTVAKATGCDAIHPGYGFLSENADFADACREAGLVFIGPSGDTIRQAGNKAQARRLMSQGAVPVVPGSDGLLENEEQALAAAQAVGYPVLLKAAAGGGGRGIRLVETPQELPAALAAAQAEADACFGDRSMYLEKAILSPRHIEFQILADSQGHILHLGDRDCSLQRKKQKLIEEAPARVLTDNLRREMGEAAIRAARAVGYENAGTVEFLLAPDGQFYFMEINTRIQVEHGITELVTGIDLVREQIRIAAGLPLGRTQEEIVFRGHALECRINAEDPAQDFRPCPGQVDFVHFPGGCGVRVDSALFTGYQVPPYYDSLAAKVMVHAPTRLEAIRRMRRALEELTVDGFATTAEFAHMILYHPAFVRGGCTTDFLETHLAELSAWSQAGESEVRA